MTALAISYGVQAAIILAAVTALAVWLRRRTKVGYGLFFAGALVFIVSQLVHVPLNWALVPLLPSGTPWLTAAFLGLSAGLCEELSRYVGIRFVFKRVRHGEEALMLGAGHGGVEALFVAGLAVILVVQLAALAQQDPATLLEGLTAEQQVGVELLVSTSPVIPLLGALERLLVLPVHLAMTMMVTAAVARGRPWWLLAAIVFHAVLDAGAVLVSGSLGVIAAEVWLGAFTAASLVALWVLGRRLRRPPADTVDAEPTGAPLELVQTRKVYGGAVHALRGASLAIEEGTRTCLLGPNGAGKTTTIRLVTGGVAPSGGHAFLFGTRADDDGFLQSKRRLGLVPQQPGMYEDLTVRGWFELVRDLYERGDPDAIAEELALGDLLERPMAKLSGGQKRRVAIAAAVLGEPELLILDEPTAGLDPIASREVLDYLERLDPSRTILLCTHDLEEAEALCDRVVVMRDGRVLVHEAIEDLRGRMVPQLDLRISSDRAAAREALVALGREVTEDGDALRVSAADPATDAPALLRALLDRGVDVVECQIVRPSLEELFLEIVAQEHEGESDPAHDAPLEEPLPPPVPLAELFAPSTRRLLAKEWRQLRAAGSAFWTSLILPVFMMLLVPQSFIFAMRAAPADPDDTGALPDWGLLGEIGDDPTRVVLGILPLFVTIAALAAPTALITHSIVHERETRTFELLVALPVRIQQVVAAKLACAFLFTAAVCSGCLAILSVELIVLELASVIEALSLFALLFAALAQATTAALLVAVLARDFRTANNLAGVLIVPSILLVMAVSVVVAGGALRALVLAILFTLVAIAVGRVALRSATFEKLLA